MDYGKSTKLMDIELTLFGIVFLFAFVACILFVIFGQVTVRKLRKNPATKNALGFEFVSGWDILNVAGALSTPRWMREKLSTSPLSAMWANHDVLYEHTKPFDRVLARVFWFFYMFSAGAMLALVIADALGAFPD